jgi:hypothetical protein
MQGEQKAPFPRPGRRSCLVAVVALAWAAIAVGVHGRAAQEPPPARPGGEGRAASGPALSVRDFGARGDGKADDTAAVCGPLLALGLVAQVIPEPFRRGRKAVRLVLWTPGGLAWLAGGPVSFLHALSRGPRDATRRPRVEVPRHAGEG